MNKNGHDLTGFGCNIIKSIHGKEWFVYGLARLLIVRIYTEELSFQFYYPSLNVLFVENQILTLT